MVDIINNVTLAPLKGKYKTVLASSTVEGKKLTMINTITDTGSVYTTFEIHINDLFITDSNNLSDIMNKYNQIQKQ